MIQWIIKSPTVMSNALMLSNPNNSLFKVYKTNDTLVFLVEKGCSNTVVQI